MMSNGIVQFNPFIHHVGNPAGLVSSICGVLFLVLTFVVGQFQIGTFFGIMMLITAVLEVSDSSIDLGCLVEPAIARVS